LLPENYSKPFSSFQLLSSIKIQSFQTLIQSINPKVFPLL